jgi:hypothetical protein
MKEETGWACRANVYTNLQFQKPKGRDNLGDLNTVGITVVKWIRREIGGEKM